VSKVTGIVRIDASGGGLSAVGEAEQEITDALQANHELHTGEQFAGLGGFDFSDDGSDGAVDFHVERIHVALALAQGIQQRSRAGGDTFGGSAGGFLGEMTGFNGAPDDMVMGRFGGKTFNTCGTHEFSLWRRRGSAQSD